ncbi:D-2-hydroxyacid dehydrogenase [Aquibacillus halophilus]|uniref:D-2-hydroxyacid dehydrogenase n=1 Tax=Aquibacillus halophilus TaxID=930132 RepID=A0A6A8DJ78_9BACI|nr:D-2-hydroxyacid dehydrogenase [Aquibacillus halophilus]MRH44526.1 D-2-hydroxyacid dehydrogenase [Aquibacillus halophilus]
MDIKNILVTGKLYNEFKKAINIDSHRQSFRFIDEEIVSSDDLKWADAYVNFKPTANFEFHNIKWVHSLGAGVDSFLYEKKWKDDVLLTRTICSFGQRISQYCLSYYLKDLQKHDLFQKQQKANKWQPITPQLIDGQKTVVYGTGEIGQEIAKLFSSLGMEVFGVSLSGRNKPYFSKVYSTTTEFDLFSETDLLINTLPLTESTDGLFGKKIFDQLNNAVFINVGRGASLIESDLLNSLEKQNIRLAVLDVFKEEPLPKDNLLWQHNNVVITPHISAVTTVEEAVSCFLDTLDRIEKNSELKNDVDPLRGY